MCQPPLSLLPHTIRDFNFVIVDEVDGGYVSCYISVTVVRMRPIRYAMTMHLSELQCTSFCHHFNTI